MVTKTGITPKDMSMRKKTGGTDYINAALNGAEPRETDDKAYYRYGSYLIAFLLIAAAMYCRIRLLDVPLERDEGGFAYIGQQLLRGVSPYHSGNMKILPGIHFAYAGIMMLFGESPAGIHIGLLVINLLSVVFLYLLARRMLSVGAAAIAAGSYAMLSVSQSVFGVFAHATHFVVLFALAGLFALLTGIENNRTRFVFVSGICLGISVLMKQHGVFFCLLAICYLAGNDYMRKKQIATTLQRLLILMAGIVIPYAATCLYMKIDGVFNEFWFWTVTRSMDYATGHFTDIDLFALLNHFKGMSLNVAFFWILPLIGLSILFLSGIQLCYKWFFASLFFTSVLAVLPGLSFYPHYFVLMLPSLALLSGLVFEMLPLLAASLIGIRNARNAVLILFLSATVFTCYSRFSYLFTLSPYLVSRTIYGVNPFPESLEIAKYIKNNSAPGTPIAVFGSEPQIYFYANRPSATDYLFMYPLVAQQPYAIKMQQEMMSEIQTSAPEYVVLVRVLTSWLFNGDIAAPLLAWIDKNLKQYYRQVGVVELASFYGSNYFWDKDAENRRPSTENYVLVFKKNTAF